MSVTEQQGFLSEKWAVNINRGIEGMFLKRGWNSCAVPEKSKLITPRGPSKCVKNSWSSSCSEVSKEVVGKRQNVNIHLVSDTIGVTKMIVTLSRDLPYHSSSKEQTINQQENFKLRVKTDAGAENQSLYYSLHLVLLKPHKSSSLVTRH